VNALRVAMIAVTLVLILGCKTGPDYKKPDVSVPGNWSEPLANGEKPDSAQLASWWKVFADPLLESLVTRAVESNFDLKIAEARVREARAALRVTDAGLWPQINVSGSYTRTQSQAISSAAAGAGSSTGTSGALTQGEPSATIPSTGSSGEGSSTSTPKRQNDLYQAGFDASWELDVFGGTRREKEASKADLEAAEENRKDTMVTLVAEVARNYFGLRAVQSRLEIAQRNIKIQQDSLDITRARFQSGLTSELDVKRAEALLSSTQAPVPGLEAAAKQAVHRLGVLLGCAPGALQAELAAAVALPANPPEVPVGLPADLVVRRPDVRRAERQFAAATARIGVANADLYPKFSLTGSFSGVSTDFDGLRLDANHIWAIGPSIRWPIFDGGRIRANIRIQNARQEQALAAYEKAVMGSLEEVENALVAYAKEQNSLVYLGQAFDANQRALDMANELYSKGLVDFLNVLDAERSLFAAEDLRTQSKAAVLTNLVALYKSLGGGWDYEACTQQEQTAANGTAP